MAETTFLKISAVGGVCVARITTPSVRDHEAEALRGDFTRLILAHGGRLVVDFSEVLMLGSSGLGVLLQIRQHCASAGPAGKLVLACISPEIEGMLKVAKLHKLFTLARTADEGVALFP